MSHRLSEGSLRELCGKRCGGCVRGVRIEARDASISSLFRQQEVGSTRSNQAMVSVDDLTASQRLAFVHCIRIVITLLRKGNKRDLPRS